MKPIGTITQYYPFLKKDTITFVEDILGQVSDYRAFVSLLINQTKDLEEGSEKGRLAVIHAWHLDDDELNRFFQNRCENDIVMKPWSYINRRESTGPWTEEGWSGLRIALKDAISSNPPEWLNFMIHLLGVILLLSPYWQPFRDGAVRLATHNQDLIRFTSHIDYWMAYVDNSQGDSESALMKLDNAREIATKYDDRHFLAIIGDFYGTILMNTDVQRGLDILQSSYEAFKTLGDRKHAGFSARGMGIAYSILGEYDLANKFGTEAMNIAAKSIESPSHTAAHMAVIMAGILSDMDRHGEALEWIQFLGGSPTEDFPASPAEPDISLILALCRTLIESGKLELVQRHLKKSNRLVLERGANDSLAKYNYIEGLYELAIGEPIQSMQTLEESLEFWEEANRQSYVNRCLVALTKAESAAVTKNLQNGESDASGRWMRKLEAHARKKMYPGIRIQHAILKAEYLSSIGRDLDARYTLEEALTYSDSIGVKTLREKINQKLDSIQVISKEKR